MSLFTLCRLRPCERPSDRVCVDGRSLCVVDGPQQPEQSGTPGSSYRDLAQRRHGCSPPRARGQPHSVTSARAAQRGQPPPGAAAHTALTAPLAVQFDALLSSDSGADASYTRQDDVFSACVPHLRTALKQRGVCNIIVHGSAGSGKRHTLMGNIYAHNEHGLVPRTVGLALSDLTQQPDETRPNTEIAPVAAAASFVELAGEQSISLLRDGDCAATAVAIKPKLSPPKQRASASGGRCGLSPLVCQPTVAQVVTCYMRGLERRRRACAASCFQVSLLRSDGTAICTIRFVELAVPETPSRPAGPTVSPKLSARLGSSTGSRSGGLSTRGGASGRDNGDLAGLEKHLMSRLGYEPPGAGQASSQLAQVLQPCCDGQQDTISILCARLDDGHIPALTSSLRLPWLLQQLGEHRDMPRSDRSNVNALATERRVLDVATSARQNQLTQRQPLQQSLQRLLKRMEQPLQPRQSRDQLHRQRQPENKPAPTSVPVSVEAPKQRNAQPPPSAVPAQSLWSSPPVPTSCPVPASPEVTSGPARSEDVTQGEHRATSSAEAKTESQDGIGPEGKENHSPEQDDYRRELLRCIEGKQQTVQHLQEEADKVRATCENLRLQLDHMKSRRANPQFDGPSQQETDMKLLLEKMTRDVARQEELLAAKIAERAELLDVYHGRKPVYTQPCHPPRVEEPAPVRQECNTRWQDSDDSESDMTDSTGDFGKNDSGAVGARETVLAQAARDKPKPFIPRLRLGESLGEQVLPPPTSNQQKGQTAVTPQLGMESNQLSSPSVASSCASQESSPRRTLCESPSDGPRRGLQRSVSRTDLRGPPQSTLIRGPLWFNAANSGTDTPTPHSWSAQAASMLPAPSAIPEMPCELEQSVDSSACSGVGEVVTSPMVATPPAALTTPTPAAGVRTPGVGGACMTRSESSKSTRWPSPSIVDAGRRPIVAGDVAVSPGNHIFDRGSQSPVRRKAVAAASPWAASPSRFVCNSGAATPSATPPPPGPLLGPALGRRCHSLATLLPQQPSGVAVVAPSPPVSLLTAARPPDLAQSRSAASLTGDARSGAACSSSVCGNGGGVKLSRSAAGGPQARSNPFSRGGGGHVGGHGAAPVSRAPATGSQTTSLNASTTAMSHASNVQSTPAAGANPSGMTRGPGANLPPHRSRSTACLLVGSPAASSQGACAGSPNSLPARRAASTANLHSTPTAGVVASGAAGCQVAARASVATTPTRERPATTPTRERRGGNASSAGACHETGANVSTSSRHGYPVVGQRAARPPPRCTGSGFK